MENKRLLSLDVLRGMTIAGMILVNNPGSWAAVYPALSHAKWNGLNFADTVFPFFIFVMGISTYLSLKKFDFKISGAALFKIFKRALIIFFLGLFLHWLGDALSAHLSGKNIFNFENLRIMGVLQRLALVYLITALCALLIKYKYIPYAAGAMLGGYFIVLLIGNGFTFSESNIVSIADKVVLGAKHMYRDGTILFDPEGLLSTIAAAAQCMLGFYLGKTFFEKKNKQLLIAGAIMLVVGIIFSFICPVNKKIWSPSYVILTSAVACLLLGALVWIIDEKGYKKWSVFFESFGVNPLFIFVFAGICARIFNIVKFPFGEGQSTVRALVYNIWLKPALGAYLASFLYSLLFIVFMWSIGFVLYKKKIYIKI